MSIANYIREIGRGKEGARSLDRAQARDLMERVLDGTVSDLEIGAFAIAMRIKGESADELAGFLDATHARCIAIDTSQPTIVLPSYNGARKLPNLTALLALLLAQEGIRVLVHGLAEDAGRVTTAAVFRDLGLPIASDATQVDDAWARHEPAFIRTEHLCPPLARLLDVRRVLGLRNSAHTIGKLLAPGVPGRSLRVVNFTHPEYGHLLRDYLQQAGADAALMRGTEGEPVADPRRAPRIDVFVGGEPRPELGVAPQEGVLLQMPLLPRSIDAPTTALYIQSVVSGEKPAPPPLLAQVACLRGALAAMQAQPVREHIA
ncbi:DNA-binding protein YbiB [Piscinibacter koreensis]|uniref:DNA-binding protein YbiB n=1 Tax=Piscinibacter koreensis TaxID=2742824 RepID=A0A7Y6NS02_9BURK|nr:DNA-binding protein YbiB [Schlegelella koreensis]NUZ08107.1 DNA-binding protein YbiB [Schlegelella koreensis]